MPVPVAESRLPSRYSIALPILQIALLTPQCILARVQPSYLGRILPTLPALLALSSDLHQVLQAKLLCRWLHLWLVQLAHLHLRLQLDLLLQPTPPWQLWLQVQRLFTHHLFGRLLCYLMAFGLVYPALLAPITLCL